MNFGVSSDPAKIRATTLRVWVRKDRSLIKACSLCRFSPWYSPLVVSPWSYLTHEFSIGLHSRVRLHHANKRYKIAKG